MSEDSIASESLSCRTESGAPLPPRKRLLAGFKQNGWSSPSSSSCAGPVEEMQVKANLEEGAMAKHEERDYESVEDGDGGAAQAPKCVEESMDSDNRRQRKSKRHRTSSQKTKKKKKVAAEGKVIAAEKDLDAKVLSIAETEKDVDDVDAVMVKVSFEAEEVAVALAPAERDANAVVKAKEEEEPACAGVLKLRRNPNSKSKEEEAACNEALKPRRNPGNKAKEEEDSITASDEALKPRRNPSRQHHSRNKDVEQKKQEAQHGRSSQMPPPLADEELARQLHRAMNSSPRISRCLSHKEDGPVLSSNRKHYPGG